MSPPSREYGIAMLVAGSFGWGLNWPAMKIALNEVPLWQFRGVTGVAGGVLLFLLALALGQRLAVPRRQWPALAAAAFFNVTAWFMLVGYGVQLMASSHVAILAFTMPLWVAVIGIAFLGERPTPRRLMSLGLGTLGVVALLSKDIGAVGDSVTGALVTLLAAFLWAIGVHVQKRVAWAVDSVPLAAWQIGAGSLPILALALAIEPFVYHRVSATALASSAYVVVVALAFSYFAWFTVVRIFPATVSAIGSLLVPVIGAASAALALGEPFGWRETASLVLVVGAVALVMLYPPAASEPARPESARTEQA